MKKYKFEIQELIEVEEEGNTREEARTRVVDKLSGGHYEMGSSNSYVSDGVELI